MEGERHTVLSLVWWSSNQAPNEKWTHADTTNITTAGASAGFAEGEHRQRQTEVAAVVEHHRRHQGLGDPGRTRDQPAGHARADDDHHGREQRQVLAEAEVLPTSAPNTSAGTNTSMFLLACDRSAARPTK